MLLKHRVMIHHHPKILHFTTLSLWQVGPPLPFEVLKNVIYTSWAQQPFTWEWAPHTGTHPHVKGCCAPDV
jgi:hypothetical protein